MNIMITGAAGFIGKNLVATLEAIQNGADRTHPRLQITGLFLCGSNTAWDIWEESCRKADFVFHLAGANRPEDPAQFHETNVGLTQKLLNTLNKYHNHCPVMLASSLQADPHHRRNADYGASKEAAENLLFAHGHHTGADIFVYRLPNVFGKWCRPNYNSVVATFCHNMARSLPITVHDPETLLELVYIDDVVEEMLCALEGKAHKEGKFCNVPVTHRATLGQIATLLTRFQQLPASRILPEMAPGSFEKKLCSTYLSYLPADAVAFPLKMNRDARGSFTELLKTEKCGQFSVNITKPGITKGQHWHHSKWEFFMVVSGEAVIRQRCLATGTISECYVNSDTIQAVQMLPGYTHSITNASATQDLVTVMWANECFDPEKPDTFYQEV